MRLRLFAGPNGSGKTTLYDIITRKCDLGVFVNADNIEKLLHTKGFIDFTEYNILINKQQFITDFKKSSLFKLANGEVLTPYLKWMNDNCLAISGFKNINSYFAAYIAEFIRNELVMAGHKLTFESVMSDRRKLDFLQKARDRGYRIYLYYITTIDVAINIGRVEARVLQEGHSVPEDKIRSRYIKSLDNLLDAIKLSDRIYLFDNSFQSPTLIAEINDGLIDCKTDFVPSWFQEYVINKIPNI